MNYLVSLWLLGAHTILLVWGLWTIFCCCVSWPCFVLICALKTEYLMETVYRSQEFSPCVPVLSLIFCLVISFVILFGLPHTPRVIFLSQWDCGLCLGFPYIASVCDLSLVSHVIEFNHRVLLIGSPSLKDCPSLPSGECPELMLHTFHQFF